MRTYGSQGVLGMASAAPARLSSSRAQRSNLEAPYSGPHDEHCFCKQPLLISHKKAPRRRRQRSPPSPKLSYLKIPSHLTAPGSPGKLAACTEAAKIGWDIVAARRFDERGCAGTPSHDEQILPAPASRSGCQPRRGDPGAKEPVTDPRYSPISGASP